MDFKYLKKKKHLIKILLMLLGPRKSNKCRQVAYWGGPGTRYADDELANESTSFSMK